MGGVWYKIPAFFPEYVGTFPFFPLCKGGYVLGKQKFEKAQPPFPGNNAHQKFI